MDISQIIMKSTRTVSLFIGFIVFMKCCMLKGKVVT